MREKAAEMEENKVDVRREDKTIRPFQIPSQNDLVNEFLKITKVTIIKNHEEIQKQVNVYLVKNYSPYSYVTCMCNCRKSICWNFVKKFP